MVYDKRKRKSDGIRAQRHEYGTFCAEFGTRGGECGGTGRIRDAEESKSITCGRGERRGKAFAEKHGYSRDDAFLCEKARDKRGGYSVIAKTDRFQNKCGKTRDKCENAFIGGRRRRKMRIQ